MKVGRVFSGAERRPDKQTATHLEVAVLAFAALVRAWKPLSPAALPVLGLLGTVIGGSVHGVAAGLPLALAEAVLLVDVALLVGIGAVELVAEVAEAGTLLAALPGGGG